MFVFVEIGDDGFLVWSKEVVFEAAEVDVVTHPTDGVTGVLVMKSSDEGENTVLFN